MDITEEILSKLQLITLDAINHAGTKALEFEPDDESTLIPFARSLSELDWAQSQLIGAIEAGKFDKLPLGKQRRMSDLLDRIISELSSIESGNDYRKSLASAIEDLYEIAWDSGIHNLSDKFLGYQSKMNSLKDFEAELLQSQVTLEKGLSLSEKLDTSSKSIFGLEALSKDKESTLQSLVTTGNEQINDASNRGNNSAFSD